MVKVDGKVRRDTTFPAGFMDVITLEKTNEAFRLIYDVKGRFAVHRITAEEARYKLCKITKQGVAQKVNYFLSYLGLSKHIYKIIFRVFHSSLPTMPVPSDTQTQTSRSTIPLFLISKLVLSPNT